MLITAKDCIVEDHTFSNYVSHTLCLVRDRYINYNQIYRYGDVSRGLKMN